MQRLRTSVALLGARALGSLTLNVAGAMMLSAMELSIAVFLQVFLQSLGLLSTAVQLPAWLERWQPSSSEAALLLVSISGVRFIAQVLVTQASTVALETISQRLRLLAAWEMLLDPRRPYVPASRMTLQLSEHFTKGATFGYAFAAMVGAAIQGLCLSVVLLFVAPREASIALIGLGFTGVFVLLVQRKSRAYANRVPEALSGVTRAIERVARNLFLVRALRTERVEHERFRVGIDGYAKHAISAGAWANLASATAPFMGTLLIVVVVTASERVFHTPGLTLLSFLYLFVRFVQALSNTVYQLSTCNQYAPQYFACLEYVDRIGLPGLRAALAPEPPERTPWRQAAAPRIEFSSVSYRYDDDAPWVLRDFSAQVEAGQQFAVIGPSGAGKSTLLAMVLGVNEPSAGTVRLDGISPHDYFAQGRAVGYVGAEAYLIAGTVRDNLRYGLPAGLPDDDEAMWQALRRARLEDAVQALPRGLSHELREDGSGLSAGQKQRLCLARALLAQPPLLVLDEASANLDEATERELAEMLRELRGQVTVVVVSHRPALVRYADCTLDLSQRS